MRVGIVCRYQANSSTFAALAMARVLTQQRIAVSFYSRTKLPTFTVDTDWDKQITGPGESFTEWGKTCQTLVWFQPPPVDEVRWAKRQGIRAVLVANWLELSCRCYSQLEPFDSVLSPVRVACDYLRDRLGLENVYPCPWALGLPSVCRPTNGYQRLLVPVFDDGAKTLKQLLMGLEWLLTALPAVSVCVPHTGRLSTVCQRRLSALTKRHPQLQLVVDKAIGRRHLYYGQADLTLLYKPEDDFGLAALTSLTMGTPIVGFNCPPWNELDLDPGCLATCTQTFGSQLAPQVDVDFGELVALAAKVVCTKPAAGDTRDWVAHRTQQFARTIYRELVGHAGDS